MVKLPLALLDPPIGGAQGRELAKQELQKPIYHRDDPSALSRFLTTIKNWIDSLSRTVENPGRGGGGGIVALVIILLVLVALIVFVLWWMRRRNAKSGHDALLGEEVLAARDHRTLAERLADEGRYAEAIRERLRAIARDLEERAILDPRPGRTADELAGEAGRALPELATALADGVRVFDDVWYGDRPGTEEGYEALTGLEERVRTTKPRPLDPADPAPAPAGLGRPH
jgi:uncharacterized membrane protein